MDQSKINFFSNQSKHDNLWQIVGPKKSISQESKMETKKKASEEEKVIDAGTELLKKYEGIGMVMIFYFNLLFY